MKFDTSTMTRNGSRFRRASTAILSALALVGALATIGGTAQGEELAVTDVSATASGPTAPPGVTGPFTVTGTITNNGALTELAPTLTFTASGGSVTASAEGCPVANAAATCAAGPLDAGTAKTFHVTVAPSDGATSVVTTVTARTTGVEVSVPPAESNDVATVTTPVSHASTTQLSVSPKNDAGSPEIRNARDALLSTTVKNTGVAETYTITVDTGGTPHPAALELPNVCGVSGGAITCTKTLATGETFAFDAAATTAATGTQMASKATATGAHGASSTSGTVLSALSPTAAAFVPDGDSLTDNDAAGAQTMNVIANSTFGLVLRMRAVPQPLDGCGPGVTCQPWAFQALFDNTGPYSAGNVDNPLMWTVKPARNACNGKSPDKCIPICIVKSFIGNAYVPGNTNCEPPPKCLTYQTNKPLAPARLRSIDEWCINFISPETGGQRTYTLAGLKDIKVPIFG
jgi:hypothetical protein